MPCSNPVTALTTAAMPLLDYRAIDPHLGTMADFEHLTEQLRANDISLMIDFVCNHTADDHGWAQRARAGEKSVSRLLLHVLRTDTARPIRTNTAHYFPESKQGNFYF